MAVEILGILAANVPPKPQHVSVLVHLDQFEVRARPRKQHAWLFLDREFPQAMAAIVKRHSRRKTCTHVTHPEYTNEEVRKLVYLRCHELMPYASLWLAT